MTRRTLVTIKDVPTCIVRESDLQGCPVLAAKGKKRIINDCSYNFVASWLVRSSPDPAVLRSACSSPGHGDCVVFLYKTLYSHSTSLHPAVQMDTGDFNAMGNPAMD